MHRVLIVYAVAMVVLTVGVHLIAGLYGPYDPVGDAAITGCIACGCLVVALVGKCSLGFGSKRFVAAIAAAAVASSCAFVAIVGPLAVSLVACGCWLFLIASVAAPSKDATVPKAETSMPPVASHPIKASASHDARDTAESQWWTLVVEGCTIYTAMIIGGISWRFPDASDGGGIGWSIAVACVGIVTMCSFWRTAPERQQHPTMRTVQETSFSRHAEPSRASQ